MELEKLMRRTVRYWCFRFRTEVLEGVSSNGAPEGLKKHIESIEGFGGWDKFAGSWDFPHDPSCGLDPCECARTIIDYRIIPRRFSVWEEWHATVRAEAPIHPAYNKNIKVMDDE